MAELKVCYCSNCLGKDNKSHKIKFPSGTVMPMKHYTFYNGFIVNDFAKDCPVCHGQIIEMNLNMQDWIYITAVSLDQDFIFAMDKLKKDDVIDFNLKIAQFKQSYETVEFARIQAKNSSESNTIKPKCPTCGSTNIKKISATKRWVGTGLFGLASSDLGKTMQCDECGYKW